MMRIRAATDGDLPQLTELYNHYILHTSATFDLEPFTVERRRAEWFSQYSESGPHRVLVAEDDDGQILGKAYSGPLHRKAAYASSVELSVYCRDGETARGIGPMLVQALIQELQQVEGLHQLFALITLPNEPSEKAIQRLGFTRCGIWREAGYKFGKYWDVAFWQRPLLLDSDESGDAL